MISNVTSDFIDHTQYKIYEWERTLAGAGDLQKRIANPNPIISRIAAVAFVLCDQALEIARPVAKTVECAAFAAFSLLCIPYHIGKGDGAKRAMRLTFLNTHDAVYSFISIPLKVLAMPLFLIAQMSMTVIYPENGRSIKNNFNIACLIKDEERTYGNNGRYFWNGHKDEQLTPSGRYFSNSQTVWCNFIKQVASNTSVIRWLYIPLSCIVAHADLTCEIVKKVCMTVEFLARGVFGLVMIPIQYALGKDLIVYSEIMRAFTLIKLSVDSLAHAITSLALYDLTWYCQAATLCYDPENATPSRDGLLTGQKGDQRYRIVDKDSQGPWEAGEPRFARDEFYSSFWMSVAS